MSEGTDGSERMIADWTRQVQQQAQRYQAMAERVQEITVTERSPDNAVEVTINSKGLLTGLTLAESAQGRRMAELSSQIMRTVRAAQARVPELLQEAMAETVGTEDETAAKVFADAKQTFPEPPDEEGREPPQADTEFRFGPEGDDPADGPAEDPAPPADSSRRSGRPRGPDRDSGDDPEDDDFGGRSIFS
ncbi:YbaB/EbfC family nucleoid-associated protein [Saccharomonospora halophila]|uniref:YbaB/EbfC family nucleoid-associated protein n=1 Tax=Saccharomonospora halophila TaxID=129922 RepID=UPI0003795646|nr:YbaB/EbfC family nucleoid-associated protein [Saccharomonospora halophila]